jgi:hypothetical protein
VPTLEYDRVTASDIEAVLALIQEPDFLQQV